MLSNLGLKFQDKILIFSREPFEPGWMAAETTRCYSTPSCGAGTLDALSPQLWTSQEPSTAWNTVPSCGQQKQLAFHFCWSITSRAFTPAVPHCCRAQTGHQSLSKWRGELSKGTPVIFNLVIDQLLRSLP